MPLGHSAGRRDATLREKLEAGYRRRLLNLLYMPQQVPSQNGTLKIANLF